MTTTHHIPHKPRKAALGSLSQFPYGTHAGRHIAPSWPESRLDPYMRKLFESGCKYIACTTFVAALLFGLGGCGEETIQQAARIEQINQAAEKRVQDARREVQEAERQRQIAERARIEADKARQVAEQEAKFALNLAWMMAIVVVVALLLGAWLGSSTRRAANASLMPVDRRWTPRQ